MPQFVGSVRDERTVRDLLAAVARPPVRAAALAVDAAGLAIRERGGEAARLACARALSDGGGAGGYPAGTVWDRLGPVRDGRARWNARRTSGSAPPPAASRPASGVAPRTGRTRVEQAVIRRGAGSARRYGT
jgi:hypothetical protein